MNGVAASERAGRDEVAVPRRPTAGELRALTLAELVELFTDLEAPTLDEMDGEYRARLLAQGGRLADVVARAAVNAPGRWLGKAFQPLGADEGHGYNSFRRLFGVKRCYRMRTYVGPSRYDQRRSYHLDYAPFNRGILRTMHDEVRKVADGLYLGIGSVGLTEAWRGVRHPFVLEGPVGPFVARGE